MIDARLLPFRSHNVSSARLPSLVTRCNSWTALSLKGTRSMSTESSFHLDGDDDDCTQQSVLCSEVSHRSRSPGLICFISFHALPDTHHDYSSSSSPQPSSPFSITFFLNASHGIAVQVLLARICFEGSPQAARTLACPYEALLRMRRLIPLTSRVRTPSRRA